MRPQATFSFFIFLQLFLFFHSPRRSFLVVSPSSSLLLPPRCSFLLVAPSSPFLFLPRPAVSKSVRGHFSSILTKALWTDGPTDRRTDQPTNRRTRPFIEMRTHLTREAVTLGRERTRESGRKRDRIRERGRIQDRNIHRDVAGRQHGLDKPRSSLSTPIKYYARRFLGNCCSYSKRTTCCAGSRRLSHRRPPPLPSSTCLASACAPSTKTGRNSTAATLTGSRRPSGLNGNY